MDRRATNSTDEHTLGEELARLRSTGFVGRTTELEAVQELLSDPPPFRVLLLTGTSGVGKTTLLHAFHREAERAGIPCHFVDARDLPSDVDQIAATLNRHQPQTGTDFVLMLDTLEALAGRERWLRDHYLPQLPASVRVVIAGRWQPAPSWHTDPGWAALTRTCRLEDFTLDEVGAYLKRQGFEPRRAQEVHQFTRGHPLAVGMVTALLHEHPERGLDFESIPELVRILVGQHLDEAPSDLARRALYTAGITRTLSEGMLAALLGVDEAHELLDWLARHSFMRTTPRGLQPHELVGEALRRELKWRDPDLHRDLVRRATIYLGDRFAEDNSEAAVQDFLFVLREYPAMKAAFVVEQDTGLHLDAAREGDRALLADMVEGFEGRRSRRWFEFWTERRPEGLRVLRDGEETIVGFAYYIDLSHLNAGEWEDPAIARLNTYLRRHGPLRRNERADLCRFIMARSGHQSPSAAMTQLQSYNALRAFRDPALAFQATVRSDQPETRTLARLSSVPPLPGCEFELDGFSYFLMGHDWRLEPPALWVRNVAERLLANQADTAGDVRLGTVFDESAFATAVEDALRERGRGRDLADCRLLQSCLLRMRAEAADNPGHAVARVIEQAVAEMAAEPGQAEHARVLERTYLNPAPKQLAAAEAVGLSYGTYRRRLREARRLLIERLWQCELEATREQRS